MSFKRQGRRTALYSALYIGAAFAITGCSGSNALSTGVSETYKQGYVVDQDTLDLVPAGSSREQVLLALGTPTTVNNFDNEVFYYISQTRKRGAQFLKPKLVDQRVLAVYFNSENTVDRIADYGAKDGKIFDFVTRTTPTGGKDQTFLAQILSGSLGASAASALGR